MGEQRQFQARISEGDLIVYRICVRIFFFKNQEHEDPISARNQETVNYGLLYSASQPELLQEHIALIYSASDL